MYVRLALVGVLAAGLALAQEIEPENSRRPDVVEKWSSELLKAADRTVVVAEQAVRATEDLHQERSAAGDDGGSLIPDQRPSAYAEVLIRKAAGLFQTEASPSVQSHASPFTVDLFKPEGSRANTHQTNQWGLIIRQILEREGLPPELVAVPLVESGFNPSALSPRGARGLWQLMPETARRFGLRVDAFADERTDPLRSTVAAISYLKDLYGSLRNWPLALAAYNAGLARVVGAIQRGAPNFASMADRKLLPEETLRYVPLVLGTSHGMSFRRGAIEQKERLAGR